MFGGWFTESSCADENRYVFNAFPAQNMTLYAKWLPDGAYAFITYYGNGVPLADPIPVEKGTQFVDPAADFFGSDIVTDGWYTNADRVNRYAGGTVSRDLNLYTTYYTKGLRSTQAACRDTPAPPSRCLSPDLYNGIEITRIGGGRLPRQRRALRAPARGHHAGGRLCLSTAAATSRRSTSRTR